MRCVSSFSGMYISFRRVKRGKTNSWIKDLCENVYFCQKGLNKKKPLVADPDRKEFKRLKQEISQDQIDVVISVRAAMIARDWGQFMEFMEICEKAQVELLCLDEVEDAGRIFQRIQKFIVTYFGESEETCG